MTQTTASPTTQPQATDRAGTARPQRADAVRNRNKVIATARALFADEGVDVALERVAAEAGVGVGTLYRNFPSREALIEAVYRSQSEEIVANGVRAFRTLPPDEALLAVFEDYVRNASSKRGMKEAILAEIGLDAPVFVDSRRASRSMIDDILRAGQRQGVLRNDVDADVVFRLIGGLSMTCQHQGCPENDAALVRVVIDGLRAR